MKTTKLLAVRFLGAQRASSCSGSGMQVTSMKAFVGQRSTMKTSVGLCNLTPDANIPIDVGRVLMAVRRRMVRILVRMVRITVTAQLAAVAADVRGPQLSQNYLS